MIYISKNNNVIKLKDAKLSISEVNFNNGSKGTQYKWIDKDKHPIARFTTFDWWDGKNISDLYVYTNYRKNGLSYQLFDFATKKLGCVALAVRKNNEIAIHVYNRYGFYMADEDDNYYYMYLKGYQPPEQ